MELNYCKTTDKVIYNMPQEVDHHKARHISMELDHLIESAGIRNIIFDMKRTTFMDSSGIGIIIGRSRKLKYYDGGSVKVKNMSERIDLIFRSAGLYSIVEREEV